MKNKKNGYLIEEVKDVYKKEYNGRIWTEYPFIATHIFRYSLSGKDQFFRIYDKFAGVSSDNDVKLFRIIDDSESICYLRELTSREIEDLCRMLKTELEIADEKIKNLREDYERNPGWYHYRPIEEILSSYKEERDRYLYYFNLCNDVLEKIKGR